MIPVQILHRPRLMPESLLGLSVAVLVISLAGAVRLAPLPVGAGAGEVRAMPAVPAPRPATATTVVAAVERNPFRAERNRAPDRYRLPGESAIAAQSYTAAPQKLVGLQLHGIATLSGGGGVAALWAPGHPARSVRVGQSYEGYRLARIDKGGVVLVGPDTLSLRLPQADLAAASPGLN